MIMQYFSRAQAHLLSWQLRDGVVYLKSGSIVGNGLTHLEEKVGLTGNYFKII